MTSNSVTGVVDLSLFPDLKTVQIIISVFILTCNSWIAQILALKFELIHLAKL